MRLAGSLYRTRQPSGHRETRGKGKLKGRRIHSDPSRPDSQLNCATFLHIITPCFNGYSVQPERLVRSQTALLPFVVVRGRAPPNAARL